MAPELSPDEIDDELRAEATLYALDLLGPAARGAFEGRLSSSPRLRGEVQALRETAGQLAGAMPAVDPPAVLRARLLARVHATAQGTPGLHELRAREGAWEPTGVAGVSRKLLRHDPATGLSTMLVRMEQGASYPAHRHALAEQCLVLAGDLRLGDAVYSEGDFLWAEEGSDHAALHTSARNLLLIVGSPSNELQPDA